MIIQKGEDNLKKVLLIFLFLPILGCSNKDDDYILKKIMGTRLKDYMTAAIEENPKAKLFGLFFIKYSHDTSTYIFTTLMASRQSIYENQPDTFIRLKNKYVLVNFGFGNLEKTDSAKYHLMIKAMENDKFSFETDAPGTFTHTGILINTVNGKYSVIKNGFNPLDIPTVKVSEETSKDYYVPSVEELKKSRIR